MSVRPVDPYESYGQVNPHPLQAAAPAMVPPSMPIANYARQTGMLYAVSSEDLHSRTEQTRHELTAIAGAAAEEPVLDATRPSAFNELVGVQFGNEMYIGTGQRHTQSVSRLVARGMREYDRYVNSAPVRAKSVELSEQDGASTVFKLRMRMWPGTNGPASSGYSFEVLAKPPGGEEMAVRPVMRGKWSASA